MPELQSGFFLISDITGYTTYLRESELEHAQDSLSHLLDLLITETAEPLRISRLEGDAVISYALRGSLHQGQTFVEIIETIYLRFRQALETMILNTNCTCQACRNLPNLDLKFFVHFGTFMRQPLANYTELIGNDVNVVHRLTKNNISKSMDIKAYVLYTKDAVEALDIEEMTAAMIPYQESFEHVGELEMFIQDMHPIWEQKRSDLRTTVKPQETLVIEKIILPVPLATMWDYATKPEYKAILASSDSATVENRRDGRIGVGTSYQCAHGDSIKPQTIVDWQPFEQYTYKSAGPGPHEMLTTISVTPKEEGTEFAMKVSKPRGGSRLSRFAVSTVMKALMPYKGRQMMREFQTQVEIDQAANKMDEVGMTDAVVEAAPTQG